MTFRAHINAQSEKTSGNKYTVNDFILKAVVRAAATVPAVNASFDGDAIVQFKHVNLSVAIAIPEGLVTPVIKAAESKTLLEISAAVKDLAGKAKNKKLSPDEFARRHHHGEQPGFLWHRPVRRHHQPAPGGHRQHRQHPQRPGGGRKRPDRGGPAHVVGLSGDHRVVDGAVAATFLAEMRKLIENPALMLV